MDDLVLSPEADQKRRALVAAGEAEGLRAIAAAAGVTLPAPPADGAPAALNRWKLESSVAARIAIRELIRGGAAGSDTTGAAAANAIALLDSAAKRAMATSHSRIIECSLPHGLRKTFPSNQFRLELKPPVVLPPSPPPRAFKAASTLARSPVRSQSVSML
jgi:hypothetical protein